MGRNATPPATKGLRGAEKGDKGAGFVEDPRREPLVPPKKLNEQQQWVWDNVIQPAWWLQQRDVMEAFAYTCLSAALIESDFSAPAPKIETWRKLATILCLTTQEQQRAGLIGEQEPTEAEGGFFDD